MCLTMLNSSLSTFFSRICYCISLMFSTFQTIFNTPFTTIQDCPLHLPTSVNFHPMTFGQSFILSHTQCLCIHNSYNIGIIFQICNCRLCLFGGIVSSLLQFTDCTYCDFILFLYFFEHLIRAI